ncbi:hypothetical protein ACFVZU_30955, partial [Streptomyces collinus]
MTQGAGQGPEVERTATLRDFRVPAYVHETGPYVHDLPGDSAPVVDEAYPEGYTPTQRDLPVINRGDTLQVPVEPAVGGAPPPPATRPRPHRRRGGRTREQYERRSGPRVKGL